MDAKVKERVMFAIAIIGVCGTLIQLTITLKNHHENKQHIANQQELTAIQLQDAKAKQAAAQAATPTDSTT